MRRTCAASGARRLVAAVAVVAACGHPPQDGPARGPAASRPVLPAMQTERALSPSLGPARFLPDVGAPIPGVQQLPDGTRRFFFAGMRLFDHPDGSIERGREVLPGGPSRAVPLPNRLGGGWLVYIVTGTTTQLWRSRSWLDPLIPLAEVRGAVDEIVPGFDRLYARTTSGDLGGDIKAIDPDSGRQLTLDPLPPATRIHRIAFADAWRAVAVVDLRGALATFDAGNTWRPIPLDGQNVNAIGVREGEFILQTARERIVMGAGGNVRHEEPPEPRAVGNERSFGSGSEVHRVPRRPLRAAIEDGWPLDDGRGERCAVFAEDGALYRVALGNGAIRETRRSALRGGDTRCHAIPFHRAFAFACDTAEGGTVLQESEESLETREVARFAHARSIVASGNGGLVVRGPCTRDAVVLPGTAAFCVFSPAGEEREVKPPPVPADQVSDLRPVSLRDGRVSFVLAPDAASQGALFVSRGVAFDRVALAPFDERRTPPSRPYFLDGIEEREPGVLGGWMLNGEELRGYRLSLDGHLTVSRASASIERSVVAGRYGFDWGSSGRGYETTDGGMTWTPVDLPLSEPLQALRSVAACGPIGCAKDNWMRVGWGAVPASPDLLPAPVPKPSLVALAPARGVAMRCDPTGEVSGPAKPAPPAATPTPARATSGRSPRAAKVSPSVATAAPTGPPVPVRKPLSPFRGQPPPALGRSEVGVEAGTDPPMIMQARFYAWGPVGADWSRGGHLQVRFDDRFDFPGVRVSATTAAPWTDEDHASDGLGLTPGQTISWSALLDPSGQAAVLVGPRGAGRADLYAVAQGEPLVAWRDAENGSLPLPSSVVRIGPTWYFVTYTMAAGAWSAIVYRVDAGVVRRLTRLPRVPVPVASLPLGELSPKLIRRAQGSGIGLLVQGAPGFNQMVRDWYVLPLDPDTGEAGEPIRLFGSDLEGQIPPRCAADSDGWMVNTDLSYPPVAQISSPFAPTLSAYELRLRLEPGSACVDAIAARTEAPITRGGPTRRLARDGDSTELPLVATDPASGRRWLLRCHP